MFRKPFVDSDDGDNLENLSWSTNYVHALIVNEVRNANAYLRPWMHGAGNAYKNKYSAINCNFENTDCYDVRIMPSITAINSNGGYSSGGQELIITGTSLNGTASVDVAGVTCDVTEATFYQIKCTTNAGTVDAGTYFAGEHGLRLKTYGSSTSFANYASTSLTKEKLTTQYEIPYKSSDSEHTAILQMSGYFQAPVTGKYQFHQSCDDTCKFFLGTSMDPASKVEHMYDAKSRSKKTYSFRDFGTHRFSNVATTVTVDDSTVVDGAPWSELKIDALDTGYTSTLAYTSLTSDDQALVDSLIVAQADTSRVSSGVLQSTLTTTQLTDTSPIGVETWAEIRTAAMKPGYDSGLYTADE
jgi:hypothetical protein